MDTLIDWLFTRQWWTYNPSADWYAQPYHWINLVEGVFWLGFAVAVLRRWQKAGREHDGTLEVCYALAFVMFALSDFREAYAVHSWLILFKGVNLVVLLRLRWLVIRRWYPQSKTY